MKEHPIYKKYFVTEDGEVYSGKYGKLRKLKPYCSKQDNFKRYNISDKGKVKCLTEHRLVADCYLPNPNDYCTIRHLNNDRTDNRLSNLEWYDHHKDVLTNNYKIEHEILNVDTGEIIKVQNLKQWCIDNNIGYYSLTYTNPKSKRCKSHSYKGYKILRSYNFFSS